MVLAKGLKYELENKNLINVKTILKFFHHFHSRAKVMITVVAHRTLAYVVCLSACVCVYVFVCV